MHLVISETSCKTLIWLIDDDPNCSYTFDSKNVKITQPNNRKVRLEDAKAREGFEYVTFTFAAK